MLKINKDECSGCGVCSIICPVGAIKMAENEEGFTYPLIDKKKCIECKACDKICSFLNWEKLVNKKSTDCYAVQIKDKEFLNGVASGGAFAGLAFSVIDLGRYSLWGE